MFAQRIGQGLGFPQEHATVPVVTASGHKLLCFLQIWFFSEAAHPVDVSAEVIAHLNVAISSFGPCRLDPHHHNILAARGQFNTTLENRAKLLLVRNHVI